MMSGFLKGNASAPLENKDEITPRSWKTRFWPLCVGPNGAIVGHPFDAIIPNDLVWVGTPADVIERIERCEDSAPNWRRLQSP
jgi:hypothetical protein